METLNRFFPIVSLGHVLQLIFQPRMLQAGFEHIWGCYFCNKLVSFFVILFQSGNEIRISLVIFADVLKYEKIFYTKKEIAAQGRTIFVVAQNYKK